MLEEPSLGKLLVDARVVAVGVLFMATLRGCGGIAPVAVTQRCNEQSHTLRIALHPACCSRRRWTDQCQVVKQPSPLTVRVHCALTARGDPVQPPSSVLTGSAPFQGHNFMMLLSSWSSRYDLQLPTGHRRHGGPRATCERRSVRENSNE